MHKVLNYQLLVLIRIKDDGLWILGYSEIYLLRMYRMAYSLESYLEKEELLKGCISI